MFNFWKDISSHIQQVSSQASLVSRSSHGHNKNTSLQLAFVKTTLQMYRYTLTVKLRARQVFFYTSIPRGK